jgi:hypothetical protein
LEEVVSSLLRVLDRFAALRLWKATTRDRQVHALEKSRPDQERNCRSRKCAVSPAAFFSDAICLGAPQ